MLAASGWPKMPKTPHSSLNLSGNCGACLIILGHRCVKKCSIAVAQRCSASLTATSITGIAVDADDQPIPAGLADARGPATPRRPCHGRRTLVYIGRCDADQDSRRPTSPKSAAAASTDVALHAGPSSDSRAEPARVEAALGQRHRQPAIRTVVRRTQQRRPAPARPAAPGARAPASRLSAGGVTAQRCRDRFEVLAAAKLAAA